MTVASQCVRWLVLALAVSIVQAAAALDFPGLEPGTATAMRANDILVLENQAIEGRWDIANGHLRPRSIRDKLCNQTIELTADASECFQIVLDDDSVVRASEMSIQGRPQVEHIDRDPKLSRLAEQFDGRQITVTLTMPEHRLRVVWHGVLRDGSSYLRQVVEITAAGADVAVKQLELGTWLAPGLIGARTAGTVAGSPVVADTLFFGYEHPMARNTIDAEQGIACRLARNAVLKDGETLTQSSVIGLAPRGQLRRGFLYYVERERAHPYRPFLHYNSWYDIAWNTRKFNEAECLDAIDCFGRELVEKRGVHLDSFLFDDGWDDNKTLWQFNDGFPNGFTRLKEAAAKYGAAPGVWISPWGGYEAAFKQRVAFAKEQGFETNQRGLSLAGPKYYQRFREIVLKMEQEYGVNVFKFDGLLAGGSTNTASKNLTRDGDAMLRLIAELRSIKPDLYISQTIGTWPSPFWLHHVDSTWRGGADHSFYGRGSVRQRWLTYRDMNTYQGVVQKGPLYPLNSLMSHGLLCATYGISTLDDKDFADEVHSYFGSGTQLQEMYITASLLHDRNWDDIAEAAKWSRGNADVLVDTHWVGGDPGKGEIYGWASWCKRKGILVLRNPDDQPASLTLDLGEAFELPKGEPQHYRMKSPWRQDAEKPGFPLTAGVKHTFELQPFQVMVLEGIPAP